jgi:hypothetical protein
LAIAGATEIFRQGRAAESIVAGGRSAEWLLRIIDFEVFGVDLEAALSRSDRALGCRPLLHALLMFKVLVLQTWTCCRSEYHLKDRLSFMRFSRLA